MRTKSERIKAIEELEKLLKDFLPFLYSIEVRQVGLNFFYSSAEKQLYMQYLFFSEEKRSSWMYGQVQNEDKKRKISLFGAIRKIKMYSKELPYLGFHIISETPTYGKQEKTFYTTEIVSPTIEAVKMLKKKLYRSKKLRQKFSKKELDSI